MILGQSESKTKTLPFRHMEGDPSLIRYSSKTAEQNFMKLLGIVHYIIEVSQSKTRTLPFKTLGSGRYHFVSIAHSITSLFFCHSSTNFSSTDSGYAFDTNMYYLSFIYKYYIKTLYSWYLQYTSDLDILSRIHSNKFH